MSKKIKLSDEKQVEIAEWLCKKLGIESTEDQNVWTMTDFINFDAIQAEVWL